MSAPPLLTPPLPARGAGCPPVLALEAHAAGETTTDTVPQHLATCAACQGYVSALRAAGEAFLRARPSERFLQQLDAQRAQTGSGAAQPWGRRWLLPLSGFAVAALALVLVLPRLGDLGVGDTPRPAGPAVTFKGAGLSVYVRRGETPPRPLSPDEPVWPEDALRFELLAPQDGYAAVFERDGAGAVTVVAPFDAEVPQRVQAGTNALEDSAVLDATPGPEHFVAVFSSTPFDVAAVKAQLEEASGAFDTEPGIPAVPDALGPTCEGCAVHVVRFEKRK